MTNKKSLMLAVLCAVAPINSVVAVNEPQKQEQRFSPETIAKIKKVAFVTGLSVAAVATIVLVYKFGINRDVAKINTYETAQEILDRVLAETLVSRSVKDKVVEWFKEHSAIVNIASAGAGFIGGSKLKAAKFAAKLGGTAFKSGKSLVATRNLARYQGYARGFNEGLSAGFAKGMRTFYELLPQSLRNGHRSITAVIKQFPGIFKDLLRA